MDVIVDKPLLVLDLDETLIFATNRPLTTPCDFLAGPYYVYKRPFVELFLDTVSPVFELAIWSSSTDDYLATIMMGILSDKFRFAFQWSRSHCIRRYHPEMQECYWVKDLKKVKRLGYDLSRVLVVDDSPQKVERNYGNAVYVKPFEGETTDRELELLGTYLIGIADKPNFRAIEKRRWRTV